MVGPESVGSKRRSHSRARLSSIGIAEGGTVSAHLRVGQETLDLVARHQSPLQVLDMPDDENR